MVPYAEHPQLMNQKPQSRTRIVMPHLINKVRIDDGLDSFIGGVSDKT